MKKIFFVFVSFLFFAIVFSGVNVSKLEHYEFNSSYLIDSISTIEFPSIEGDLFHIETDSEIIEKFSFGLSLVLSVILLPVRLVIFVIDCIFKIFTIDLFVFVG